MNSDKVRVDFSDGVFAEDLTDVYNGTSLYTTSKRNLKQAQAEIKDYFVTGTSFQDIKDILDKYKVKYHIYCAID